MCLGLVLFSFRDQCFEGCCCCGGGVVVVLLLLLVFVVKLICLVLFFGWCGFVWYFCILLVGFPCLFVAGFVCASVFFLQYVTVVGI